MGNYINPGNQAFNEINDEDYVDKTMLKSEPQTQKAYLNLLRGWFKNSNESGLGYHEVKKWYDGYDFPDIGAIYTMIRKQGSAAVRLRDLEGGTRTC
ncbi:hypothetical protein [Ruminococcus sp. HUN007]|uniref:hypothetical protein n=1 Tax=Ruminococcus sp. HUN007 TaxID=1514668 RepID=UPI0005D24C2F|nr:hypothetical protein [Ruminococcus sp. HUN007]